MKTSVSNNWSNMKTTATTAWSNAKTTLTSTWTSLKTSASNAWIAMKTSVSNNWSNMKTTATTAWSNAKTTLASTWGTLKSSAATTFANMKSNVSTAWGGMKTEATSKWNDAKSTLSGTWDTIKSTASTKFDAIKSTITNKGWSGVGSGICSGIQGGINSGWTWLSGTVSNLANNLLSSAKSALGIHSPSTAFRDQVGLNIGLGIGEGVEDSEPAVLKSVSGVADAIAEEMNAGDYTLQNIVPTTEVNGALVSFSDKIADSFTNLLARLQDIAENVTFASPVLAYGAVPYRAAAAAASGGGADIGTTIEASNDELANVVTQVVTNAANSIVSAIQSYSGTTVNLDKASLSEAVIQEINRRTRANNRSPLIG